MRQPGGAEEGDQRLKVFPWEVGELPGVAVAERLPHLAQEGDAGGGDADADDPAVVGRAVADDQASLLQLVEQAGDVRGAADEASGKVQGTDGDGWSRRSRRRALYCWGVRS